MSAARFEFATAHRVLFGAGVLEQAGPLAAAFGRRALVVTGRSPNRAAPLLALLAAAGIETALAGVPGEPTIEDARRLTRLAAGCDLVIAMGGGSALDAGKAAAALAPNTGDPLNYMEVVGPGAPMPCPPLPFIAIPTTAGAGSEATRNAVLLSPEHGVKASLRSASMLPRIALVDPLLTLGLPPAVTAATGMDALTQLIEPFLCARANPMTDALCRQGIALAAGALRSACANGADIEARSAMSLAALLGGMALANAGLGAVHGFAAAVGGLGSAPHGAVCARLLGPALAANLRALRSREPASPVIPRFAEVAALVTGQSGAAPEEAAAWTAAICEELAIPRLAAMGVPASSADAIVPRARAAGSMQANPIRLTDDELHSLFAAAL